MRNLVLFHYWSESPIRAWDDGKNPVIHAIAAIRGSNKNCSIDVIDVSEHANDYGTYPESLGFVVHRKRPTIRFYNRSLLSPDRFKLCSRISDIESHARNFDGTVLFSDADVFWLKDPFPPIENPSKFCCREDNSGVFYYSPTSPDAVAFLSLWKSQIAKGLADSKFFGKVAAIYRPNADIYQDEAVLVYMNVIMKSQIQQYFQPIGFAENYCREIDIFGRVLPDIKALHLQFFHWGFERAKVACSISEIHDLISRSGLSEGEISALMSHCPYPGSIPLLKANPHPRKYRIDKIPFLP